VGFSGPSAGGTASGPFAVAGTYTGTGAALALNVASTLGISWNPNVVMVQRHAATPGGASMGWFIAGEASTDYYQQLSSTTVVAVTGDYYASGTLNLRGTSNLNVSGATYLIVGV
jgi:hypothetical protein